MTFEEQYIREHLNKNYEVRTDAHSFSILDISSDKWLTINNFRKHLSDIFMKTCYPILDAWFDEKSTALIKELNDYIVKIDFSKAPSAKLLDKLVKDFNKTKKNREKYNESFIKNIFFDYHKKHNINPMLEKMAPTMKSSNDIASIVAEFIEMEPVNIRNYIIDYLND